MEGTSVSTSHPTDPEPAAWFEIRGDEIYTTVNHPNGRGDWPWFEIRNGQVFTTDSHPQGRVALPWYEIHGNRMYTTQTHPDGYAGFPLFEIRGNMIYGVPHYSPVHAPSAAGRAADRNPEGITAEVKQLGPPESKDGNDPG